MLSLLPLDNRHRTSLEVRITFRRTKIFRCKGNSLEEFVDLLKFTLI